MRPSIGFDRDIKLEWLDAVATQVSAGRSTQEVRASIHKMLGGVLASGKPGAALAKTTTVLLHIWSQVPGQCTGAQGADRAGHAGTQPAGTACGALVDVPGDLSFLSRRGGKRGAADVAPG